MTYIKTKFNQKSLYLIFFLSIALAYLSYIRFFGVSRDYLGYQDIFLSIIERGCGSLGEDSRIEIGFQLSTCFVATFLKSPQLIYSFYVFLSILIKFYIFLLISAKSRNFTRSKPKAFFYSRTLFLPVILYASTHFVLLELTQIRNALSFSFLLLSVFIFMDVAIPERNMGKKEFLLFTSKIILGLFFWGCSVSLHNSAYIFSPFIIVAFFVKKLWHLILGMLLAFLYCWQVIPLAVKFLLDSGNKTALLYSIDELEKQGIGGNLSFGLIFLLLFIVISSFFIFIVKVKNIQQNEMKMFFYSLFLFSFMCLLTLVIRPLYIEYLLRCYNYLQVFLVCLIASMPSAREFYFTLPWVMSYSVLNTYYSMSGNYFS